MKIQTPNRPGCGGYILALLLLVAIALPALAWPQLSVRLMLSPQKQWKVDIYCPASPECVKLDVLNTWRQANVHYIDPTHIEIELDNEATVPAFWIRVWDDNGGWTDYQTKPADLFRVPRKEGEYLL